METIYYSKKEQLKSDKTHRPGTEYYYGDKEEMGRAVEHGLYWLPLVKQIFEEKHLPWLTTKNKLVPKVIPQANGKNKWDRRTPEETIDECINLMESCKEPIERNKHWGIPRHCWDKVNKVLEEGFHIIGEQDCFDDPNYGLQIEFVEGVRPLNKTKQKNNFHDIAEFLQKVKQRQKENTNG